MTEISVMTVPSEQSDGLAVRMLVSEGGVWRETQPPSGTDLSNVRALFSKALYQAVAHPDPQGGDPVDGLIAPGMALFNNLIPRDLNDMLADARDAGARDDPPQLRIHLSPAHEWIPWEVLHDSHGFLGLNFEVARLPIVLHPPRQAADHIHTVERVNSLLGRRVVEGPNDDEFKTWRDTFARLLPPQAQALVPPDELDEGWPQLKSLMDEADILHVTCHGERDDETGPYWTLDPEKPKATSLYTLSSGMVSMLARGFERRPPLVFGNACTPDQQAMPAGEPDRPPLATAFFSNGALNFVGSLAPIRRSLALPFARVFYEELLREKSPIARALLDAKRRCHDDPDVSGDPTYLFYCLYGPPETRYVAGNANGA